MCSHGVPVEALKLRLYGPCRDIHLATNLTERNILAITKWYNESPHFKYKNSSDWGSWEKGICRKQWMAFCEQLCQARPEFRCADGSTNYSHVSPEDMEIKAMERQLFWDWLDRSVHIADMKGTVSAAHQDSSCVILEICNSKYLPGPGQVST